MSTARARWLLAPTALAAVVGCRSAPFEVDADRRLIDFHTHLAPGSVADAAKLFARVGVEVAVHLSARPLTAGWLSTLAEANATVGAGPRVLAFCGVDWRRVDDADFGSVAADELRRCVAAGGAGLKIPKALGLGVRKADGRLLAVDDRRLDPLWQAAGGLGVPVAIHTGDPLAFFAPVTPDNERWEELQAHPAWSFFGGDYPSLAALLAARDRMVGRHPATTFVAVHVGGYPEDVEVVARSMRAHANLWIDVAARLPEIGRQAPSKVRAFFEEFHDRVVFGTDLQVDGDAFVLGSGGPGPPPTADDAARYYRLHWRYFETRDRSIEHLTPIQGRWTIDAVGLPREVLEAIYHGNARRLLRL